MVIQMNRLMYGCFSLFFAAETTIQVIFGFEDTIDPLGIAVLITMVLFGHANGQVAAAKTIDVLLTTILASSIGVVHGPTIVG